MESFNPIKQSEENALYHRIMTPIRTLPYHGFYERVRLRFKDLVDDYQTWRGNTLLRTEKIKELTHAAFSKETPSDLKHALAFHPEVQVRLAAVQSGELTKWFDKHLRKTDKDPEVRESAALMLRLKRFRNV